MISQVPGQSPISGVDGMNLFCFPVNEFPRESTDITTKIGTFPSLKVPAKLVENVGQFQRALGLLATPHGTLPRFSSDP
jgi:hypothetical protein